MQAPVYPRPPGLVGDIADFIFTAAPRPVHEIALAAALGLVAGIAGRPFNISGTGLNQYILLLAPTGTGKEAIASGIERLLSALRHMVPAADVFIGPGHIASAPALIKHLSGVSPCFVSLVGEFGLALRSMCAPNANATQIGLRSALLDLYNKSGNGHSLRPMIYSDTEKNTQAVIAPAFSLLGESTPESFYETLTEGMISEGLLPRFTIIEYRGPRPPLSQGHAGAAPSAALIDRLATLTACALTLAQAGRTISVQRDGPAEKLLAEFDAYCDEQINGASREVVRHLWNRAHIKALKLAGCVAVGCNPHVPVIDFGTAYWAASIAAVDARNLIARFEAGDVGKDNLESRQIAVLTEAIVTYVHAQHADIAGYGTPKELHDDKIIPWSYLHRKLHKLNVFKDDRGGASTALQRACKSLLEQGIITEVSRGDLRERFNFYGRCFMVSDFSILTGTRRK